MPQPNEATPSEPESDDPLLRHMLALTKTRRDACDLGRQEGREEGRHGGRAEALLFLLAERGLPVSEEQRARILSETDPTALEGWLRASAVAEIVGAHPRGAIPQPPRPARAMASPRKYGEPLLRQSLNITWARGDALERGREEGRRVGRHVGWAEAVVVVLGERGLMVSEEERARILAERDQRTLEGWLRGALRASVAEILATPGPGDALGPRREGEHASESAPESTGAEASVRDTPRAVQDTQLPHNPHEIQPLAPGTPLAHVSPMPSTAHELLVHVVRDSPSLVVTLLASAGLVEAGEAVTLDDAGLPSLVSALTADALVVIQRASGAKLAVVLEVQLEADDEKLYTWPIYQATARRRHRCPTLVVVLCPSERVAAWAEREVELDGHRSSFGACVFGPSHLAELDTTGGSMELKWLVAYALAGDEARGPRAWFGVSDALADLRDEAMSALYWKTLIDALSPAVRAHIEAIAMSQPNEATPSQPEDPLLRHMLDLTRARREAREAREEGRHMGRAEAVLFLLAERGLPVSEEQRARILAERDLTMLDAWFRASLRASSVAEVLDATTATQPTR